MARSGKVSCVHCAMVAIYCVFILLNQRSSANILKIGAIFSDFDSLEELAVKQAVDFINNDSSILPNYKIEFISSYTGILSTFKNIQKVCYQLNDSVTAIIGPLSSSSVKASYPMCQGFHVPMIAPGATDPTLGSRQFYKYLLRMMPSDAQQSLALADFMGYFRWDTVAILTDNTDYGINGLLQFQAEASANKWRVLSVQQFSVSNNISDVDATEQLNLIKGTGARVVILNCLASHAVHVFGQAERLGMMTSGWVWIVTDGITGFNILPELVKDRPYLAGIVGTRPSSSSGALYEAFHQIWKETTNETFGKIVDNPANNTKVSMTWPLAYYDSVLVYAHAMHAMLEDDLYKLSTEPHDCRQVPAQYWRYGDIFYGYLTKVTTDGVMRFIEFGDDSTPLHADYDIMRLGNDGWEKHGSWDDRDRLTLNVSRLYGVGGKPLYDIRDYVGDLVNKTLHVVTVTDAPFVFKTKSKTSNREGTVCGQDGCFYGYAIDLLQELARELKFNYVIREVRDGKYGRLDHETNTWNGLINTLVKTKNKDPTADLGVGAITISSERQSVVSFTKPYRDLQLGIMIGTAKETFNPWSFLTPLSLGLWGFIAGTAFVVGLMITCIDKLSPYGHHGMKSQVYGEHEHEAMDTNDDGTVDYWEMKAWKDEKKTMNCTNASLWSMASLFQQGGERHPKSWSARMAAGTWWFGVLIITASYTANLAAFLTIKNSSDGISSIEDLASRKHIRYGTVRDSQVQEFFDTAQREPYKKIADNMRKWDKYFDKTDDIVDHTLNSNGTFAMLYDLPGIYYWKGQDCRLKMVKNGYANVGYGFALPKDSPYAKEITIQIYQLRESGYMDTLDDKWLVKTALCADGDDALIDERTVQIGMPSLWGVFWIIYVGFGISFVLVGIEWLVSAYSAVDPKCVKAPNTFSESLRLRANLFKKDFLENWFVNFHRKEHKKQEQAMRPVPAAVKAAVLLKMRSSRIRNGNKTPITPDPDNNNLVGAANGSVCNSDRQ